MQKDVKISPDPNNSTERTQALLLTTFSWMTVAEAFELSRELFEISKGEKSATACLQAVGQLLDSRGLRVTAPLILGIVGRGSQRTAVDIVRNVSRARFDAARETGRSIATTQTSAALDGDAIECLAQSIARQFAEQLGGSVVGGNMVELDSHLKEFLQQLQYVAGDVRWLKSTIDSERQLHRYQHAFGPLTEPGPPKPPENVEQKRTVIRTLTGALENERHKGDGSGLPTRQRPAVDHSEDPLDM